MSVNPVTETGVGVILALKVVFEWPIEEGRVGMLLPLVMTATLINTTLINFALLTVFFLLPYPFATVLPHLLDVSCFKYGKMIVRYLN